jgi:hypothetical protein
MPNKFPYLICHESLQSLRHRKKKEKISEIPRNLPNTKWVGGVGKERKNKLKGLATFHKLTFCQNIV